MLSLRVVPLALLFALSLACNKGSGGSSAPDGSPPANDPPPGDQVACTMDAKMCPDGSAVGRQGPNCEFAPCPGEGESTSGGEVPCTKDAKVCPDGSSVGREGPNCEFAPCPGE